jgi:hypothetical protein
MKTGTTLMLGYSNTSVLTALACRVQFHSDKRVKWSRFLPPETFPPGTAHRSCRRFKLHDRTVAPERVMHLSVLVTDFVTSRRTARLTETAVSRNNHEINTFFRQGGRQHRNTRLTEMYPGQP